MNVNSQQKIIALWTVFLLGTLFHTQLALMPLFHDVSVAHTHAHGTAELAPILWGMLVFFMVPMVLIVATAFNHSKRYRAFHFIAAGVLAVGSHGTIPQVSRRRARIDFDEDALYYRSFFRQNECAPPREVRV